MKVVRTDLIACFVCAVFPVLRWKFCLCSVMCVDGVAPRPPGTDLSLELDNLTI